MFLKCIGCPNKDCIFNYDNLRQFYFYQIRWDTPFKTRKERVSEQEPEPHQSENPEPPEGKSGTTCVKIGNHSFENSEPPVCENFPAMEPCKNSVGRYCRYLSTLFVFVLCRFCPYAQRTVLVLNAKGVDYQIINCTLMDKPDWLFTFNPLGRTFYLFIYLFILCIYWPPDDSQF